LGCNYSNSWEEFLQLKLQPAKPSKPSGSRGPCHDRRWTRPCGRAWHACHRAASSQIRQRGTTPRPSGQAQHAATGRRRRPPRPQTRPAPPTPLGSRCRRRRDDGGSKGALLAPLVSWSALVIAAGHPGPNPALPLALAVVAGGGVTTTHSRTGMAGCRGGGVVDARVAKVSTGSGNFTQSERLSSCIF